MKRIVLLAVVGVALAGCQWIPGTDQHTIEKGKARIVSDVRDPASVQFRNVRLVRHEGGNPPEVLRMICGEVNEPNQFGGYNGFVRFFIEADNLSDQGATAPRREEWGDGYNLALGGFNELYSDYCRPR